MRQYNSLLIIIENFKTNEFGEIKGKVTNEIYRDFSETQNRKHGTLSKLDYFLQNSQVSGQSGNVPGTTMGFNL